MTHWTRDRGRGALFPVAWVVKRLTLGQRRRDRARTIAACCGSGLKADINVLDYDRLRLRPPEIVYDLPAGGKRLLQRTDGFDATIVSGAVVYRHGEPTGALPGRLFAVHARCKSWSSGPRTSGALISARSARGPQERKRRTMKAAYIEKFGGPEVLTYGDLPDPVAGPGQVVVDTVAASVNGADPKVAPANTSRPPFRWCRGAISRAWSVRWAPACRI